MAPRNDPVSGCGCGLVIGVVLCFFFPPLGLFWIIGTFVNFVMEMVKGDSKPPDGLGSEWMDNDGK